MKRELAKTGPKAHTSEIYGARPHTHGPAVQTPSIPRARSSSNPHSISSKLVLAVSVKFLALYLSTLVLGGRAGRCADAGEGGGVCRGGSRVAADRMHPGPCPRLRRVLWACTDAGGGPLRAV